MLDVVFCVDSLTRFAQASALLDLDCHHVAAKLHGDDLVLEYVRGHI